MKLSPLDNQQPLDLKNAVIEIAEVEYVINEKAEHAIKNREILINLIRLIDHASVSFTLKEIEDSINRQGIIDSLE